MDYRLRKHFPALVGIKWRAERILKGRTQEQIDCATEIIDQWTAEVRELRHSEETEEFIRREAARIYNDGGWELNYLPGGADYPDGSPVPHSEREIRDLLENWPRGADDRPSFPVDDMADFDALGEVLADGYPFDDIEGFESATEAELYAVLALAKSSEVERLLRVEEKRTASGIAIDAGQFPWKVSDVVRASDLLAEAMEIVCYAERQLADAQLSKMRHQMQADMETQIRQDARTAIAKVGAAARLAKDPKQLEKVVVRECWDAWQANPSRYKGVAAFARDMLQKFESLESQPVIERWCRAWAKETQPAK